MTAYINYHFPDDEIVENAVQTQKRKAIFNYPCKSLIDCHPYEVTFKRGTYQIECWGGGYNSSQINSQYHYYGYGAYTKGTIHFLVPTKLYFYIGSSNGRFNSLHPDTPLNQAGLPGGATDIRTENGNFYSFDSLKTVFMVSAGSGFSDDYDGQYGLAGALP